MRRARIVLMGLLWAMSPAWGQTVQPTNAPAPAVASPSESVPTVAQPLIPNRPIIIPSVIPPGPPNAPDRPQRPAVPEHQTPGASVQELIRNFQAARQAFSEEQKELRRRLKQATEEERAAIRQQLKENLENWLEQQRTLQRELRDQAQDLKANVQSLREVIDAAKDEGRGRGR